ncbi:hypothetical protein [Clostridium thailandense]|uniref:hypothetical protein n=1 Tax=Clostridium thailandense TaxID=2794346 RepID=UPI003989D133
MNFEKLARKIIRKYAGNLWRKHGLTRIYFDHTSKVDTYIEFYITNGKVKDEDDISVGCKYIGKPVTGYKWIKNYTHEAREYMENIARFITDLLKENN